MASQEKRLLQARLEIEKAINLAGGRQQDLARVCGIAQKNISIALRNGHMSVASAVKVVQAYPDINGLLLVGFPLEIASPSL